MAICTGGSAADLTNLLCAIKEEPLEAAGSSRELLTSKNSLEESSELYQMASSTPDDGLGVKQSENIEDYLGWEGGLLEDMNMNMDLAAFDADLLSDNLDVPSGDAECSSSGASAELDNMCLKLEVDQAFGFDVPFLPQPPSTFLPLPDTPMVPPFSPAFPMGLAPGWVPSSHHMDPTLCRPDAATARIARQASIQRYREKRNRRVFVKKIRYQSRKAYAELRPRIKGRFATKEEVAALAAAAESGN